MLLIPIGRDDTEIRRHAWVSYTIIALNVLAFILTALAMRPAAAAIQENWNSAFALLLRHPYLKPPAALKELLPIGAAEELQVQARVVPHPPAETIQEEQAELEASVARAVAAQQVLPYAKFGYVPAAPTAFTLLTSMFIHAGLLHLIGNLLFFFLSGPFVEDVYGRPLFAALYFSGGAVAALTFAARDPSSTTPLVGASGAIAAVMGAYLVRFFRSKIEFLWLPFLWRPMMNF